jgi:SAM-dependent MidA family methyltransferase
MREEVEKTADAKNKRALQTLLHPEMLGRAFQVLALEKGFDRAAPLAGFRFARNPRVLLGL